MMALYDEQESMRTYVESERYDEKIESATRIIADGDLSLYGYKKQYELSSLSDVKTAGSQYLCGFPFSVLAKCLQFLDIIKQQNKE